MRRFLLALACFAVLAGGAGCKKKKKKKKGGEAAQVDEVPKNRPKVKDYVDIVVERGGFNPKSVDAIKGRPITLRFRRETDSTCATTLVIAEENIRKELPLDKVVEIPLLPGKVGKIRYTCPTNEIGGDINVSP